MIKANQTAKQEVLINKLNEITRGWRIIIILPVPRNIALTERKRCVPIEPRRQDTMRYRCVSDVYQKISKDLVKELPEIKSFSPRNLQYMNQFYRLYPDVEITPQLDAQIDKNIIFMIPWGHHKVIMDKCKEDQQRALFFVQNTLVNNWSRAVLLNFLDTKLFDRQGNLEHMWLQSTIF